MSPRAATRSAAALGLCLAMVPAGTARAGEADVLRVAVRCDGSACEFTVTVEHADDGWDHYADRWEIVDPAGEVLAVRVLRHPHVDEQPFTRSLAGVEVPAGLTEVTVRAHDSVHAYGGLEAAVELPDRAERRERKENGAQSVLSSWTTARSGER